MVPALAVAGELRRRGHEALFIGTERGMEAQLAPRAGFPIEWIEIGGLQGVGLGRALRTVSQLPPSVLRSRAILRGRGAAAVFSMGGYVAAPVMMAAMLRGTPMVIMEPNAVPGLVARRMSRFVRRALVAFEEARRYFPKGRSEVCGLPVRKEFFEVGERDTNAAFTVLLTGGSQGSRALNRIARVCWPLLKRTLPGMRWIHQSGPAEFETMGRAFTESGLDGYVTPFIEDMAGAYAGADLIVGRSGAGAIAEIAAAGRPGRAGALSVRGRRSSAPQRGGARASRRGHRADGGPADGGAVLRRHRNIGEGPRAQAENGPLCAVHGAGGHGGTGRGCVGGGRRSALTRKRSGRNNKGTQCWMSTRRCTSRELAERA